jgi:hypothetical protein
MRSGSWLPPLLFAATLSLDVAAQALPDDWETGSILIADTFGERSLRVGIDVPGRHMIRMDWAALVFDLHTSRYLGEVSTMPLTFAVDDEGDIQNISVVGLLHFSTFIAATREHYLRRGSTFAKIHLVSSGLLNGRHHLLLIEPRYAEKGSLKGMRSLSVFVKNETDIFAFGHQRLVLSPGAGVALHLGGFTGSVGYSHTLTFDRDRLKAEPWFYIQGGVDLRTLSIH